MPEPAANLFPPFPQEDYARHRAAITEAVLRSLQSGTYILGPEVEQFEAEFAAFVDSRFAIGVASGTDAIELLLRAHGIGDGHQVVIPSHTAVATAAAVTRAGAKPVFADIDPVRFTMSPQGLASAIGAADPTRLKAVIVVHLYGQPAEMEPLLAACKEAGLLCFEDCAQAHGAAYCGRSVGVLADGGSYSFYPTKNLGAIGDAGAVVTDDPKIDQAIRELRQYGWKRRFISDTPRGVNSRLDEIQAAILREKLPTLPDQIARRRLLASLYRDQLSGIAGLGLPPEFPCSDHAYHLYVIRTRRRDQLLSHLADRGIPAALHYPAPIHRQPAFAEEASRSPLLPATDLALSEILTLPLHSHLPEEAITAAAAAVREFAVP